MSLTIGVWQISGLLELMLEWLAHRRTGILQTIQREVISGHLQGSLDDLLQRQAELGKTLAELSDKEYLVTAMMLQIQGSTKIEDDLLTYAEALSRLGLSKEPIALDLICIGVREHLGRNFEPVARGILRDLATLCHPETRPFFWEMLEMLDTEPESSHTTEETTDWPDWLNGAN